MTSQSHLPVYHLVLLGLFCLLFFLPHPTHAQPRYQWLPVSPIGECKRPGTYGFCGIAQAPHIYYCYDTWYVTPPVVADVNCEAGLPKPGNTPIPCDGPEHENRECQGFDSVCESNTGVCRCGVKSNGSSLIGMFCTESKYRWHLPTTPTGECQMHDSKCGLPYRLEGYQCWEFEFNITANATLPKVLAPRASLCDGSAPAQPTRQDCTEQQPIQCQNGGTCILSGLTTSTCECSPGWRGDLCENQIIYVWDDSAPGDDATCALAPGRFCGLKQKERTLFCKEQHSGKVVADTLCNQDTKPSKYTPCAQQTTDPKCANGGECGTDGICTCSSGWYGDLCQSKITYVWDDTDQGDDTTCTLPTDHVCGPKQKKRNVVCKTQHDGDVVADTLCNQDTKPSQYLQCVEEQTDPKCQNAGTCGADGLCACPSGFYGDLCENTVLYVWDDTDQGDDNTCTLPAGRFCGSKQKERNVFCKTKHTGDVVADSLCDQTTKPSKYLPCAQQTTDPKCVNGGECNSNGICTCTETWQGNLCETAVNFNWYGLSWGECQPRFAGQICGLKQKTRSIECRGKAVVNDSYCANKQKPSTVTTDGCGTVTPGCPINSDCNEDEQICTCKENWLGKNCDIPLEPVEFRLTSWGPCEKDQNDHVCGRPSRHRSFECYLKSTNKKLQNDDPRCQVAWANAENNDEFVNTPMHDFTTCAMLSGCKNGGYCDAQKGTGFCYCPNQYNSYSQGDCSTTKEITPPKSQYYWKYKSWGPCQLLPSENGEPQGCDLYYRKREAICVNRDANDKEMNSFWCRDTISANVESCFMWFPPCEDQTGPWIGKDLDGKDHFSSSNTAFGNSMIMSNIMISVITFTSIILVITL